MTSNLIAKQLDTIMYENNKNTKKPNIKTKLDIIKHDNLSFKIDYSHKFKSKII